MCGLEDLTTLHGYSTSNYDMNNANPRYSRNVIKGIPRGIAYEIVRGD